MPVLDEKTLRCIRRCFVFNEKCFDANEKKRRCFLPSAQKITSMGFVHNKAIHTGAKGKMVLQGITKYVQYFVHCHMIQRVPKSFYR
jgi:hypothetical protein